MVQYSGMALLRCIQLQRRTPPHVSGRGYTTEAALAMREFAHMQLGVKQLVAHCDSRNRVSARVMEKIGLTLERKGERQYPDARGRAGEFRYSCTIQ